MVKSIIIFYFMNLKNRYFLLRHGEALSNTENMISCWPEKKEFPLTEKGRKQISESAEMLKKICAKQNQNIDMIFASDLLRTKQSAEIMAGEINLEIKYDKRLREYDVGIYNGRSIFEYVKIFSSQLERFDRKAEGGEDYNDIKIRIKSFIDEKENEFIGKNILVVSHQIPIIIFLGVVKDFSNEEITKNYLDANRIKNGEIAEV